MSRRILAVGSTLGVAIALVALTQLIRMFDSQVSEPMIARPEAVPGTLGIIVGPPPSNFRPLVEEGAAFQKAFSVDPPPKVFRALGVIRDTTINDSSRPSWIFIANGICYSSGKCTVVSAARSGFQGCTAKHLSLVAVDAGGNGTVRSYEAYDPSGVWRPEIQRI